MLVEMTNAKLIAVAITVIVVIILFLIPITLKFETPLAENKTEIAANASITEINMTQIQKIEQKKSDCKGNVTVLESKCTNNNLELKVGVETAGTCNIDAFIVNINGNNYGAKFTKNENYDLIVEACGEVSKIIPIGEGGFAVG